MVYDLTPKYYVYAWYIKETNEVFYIGKGCGKRYKTRKRENSYFMRIINKYDCDVKILKDGLTEEQAFELEKEMIAYYRTVSKHMTNILDGGESPPKLTGIPKSDEWKKKCSASHKKFVKNHPEYVEQNSKRMKEFLKTEKGKEFYEKGLATRRTEQFRKKQSIRSRTANNTPEYIEKQSKIVKEMWKSEEYKLAHSGKNNCRAQSIEQYSLNGEYIATYDTVTDASTKTNTCASKMSAVASGKRKTAGGYIWKYSGQKRNKTVERNYSYNPFDDKNAKPVIQCDKQGNIIAEYISIADVVRINTEMTRSNLIACLKNRTKTAYGYIWKYKHDDTVPSLE